MDLIEEDDFASYLSDVLHSEWNQYPVADSLHSSFASTASDFSTTSEASEEKYFISNGSFNHLPGIETFPGFQNFNPFDPLSPGEMFDPFSMHQHPDESLPPPPSYQSVIKQECSQDHQYFETMEVSESSPQAESREESDGKKRKSVRKKGPGSGRRQSRPIKLYPCLYDGCTNVYLRSSHLKVHVRKHTGEKPFKCLEPGCDWSFRRSDELSRHKRCHSGVKPYSCRLCGKSFARSDHLAKHIKVHERNGNIVVPSSSSSSATYVPYVPVKTEIPDSMFSHEKDFFFDEERIFYSPPSGQPLN